MLINPRKIVVITPHPDDEVLGLGATISRFADMNIEVSILVVSGHLPPLYDQKLFNITKIEAEKATDAYLTANKKLLWTTPNFKQGVWRENGDLNTFVWTEGNFFD